MTHSDVVVVGGGPAGLAAAIMCAGRGLLTTLVERQSFPINKACGEGVLPNGVAALERLGVDMTQTRACATPIRGIRYLSSTGRTAEAMFPGAPGLGLRREDLSRLLYAHALSLPSLTLLSGHTASVIHDNDGSPVVHNGGQTWRPKLVIGADGLHSRTRDALRIPITSRPRRRWGCRQHFAETSWTDCVEVYFGRGFEIYVTPVADGVNVAVLWEPARAVVMAGSSPVTSCVAQVPALRERLRGREATDRVQADGPFDVRVPRPWRHGVLLVGDAAGYVDPITGEGVGIALEQALLLADTIVPALLRLPDNAVMPAEVLAGFTKQARAQARANRYLTRLLVRLTRHPALLDRAVGLLASQAWLFSRLLQANMGTRPLTS